MFAKRLSSSAISFFPLNPRFSGQERTQPVRRAKQTKNLCLYWSEPDGRSTRNFWFRSPIVVSYFLYLFRSGRIISVSIVCPTVNPFLLAFFFHYSKYRTRERYKKSTIIGAPEIKIPSTQGVASKQKTRTMSAFLGNFRPPPPLGILCRRAVFRRVFCFPDFQEKLAKNSPYSPLLAYYSPKLAKNSPKLA